MAFDTPTREKCVLQRQRTNTPMQALVTLNDPIFHECAQFFAKRITASHPSSEQRREYAFRSCLSRSPDAEERKMFLTFLAEEDEGADGWVSVAAILLNLDETLTRE